MLTKLGIDGRDILIPSDIDRFFYQVMGKPSWYFDSLNVRAVGKIPSVISVGSHLAIIANVMKHDPRVFVAAYVKYVPRVEARFIALGLDSAPTLREALGLIIKFGSQPCQLFRFSCEIFDDRAVFTATPQTHLGLASLPVCEGIIHLVGQHLCLGAVRKEADIIAYVTHRCNAETSVREPFEVRYDQPRIALEFPSIWLDGHSISFDQDLWRFAKSKCLAQQERAILRNKTKEMGSQILEVWDRIGHAPRLKELATLRDQSPRTLMRQLEASGVHYKELTDQMQKARAIELLAAGIYSVETVTAKLGFSDSSSFRRTFRRWFGVSPREWLRASEQRPS